VTGKAFAQGGSAAPARAPSSRRLEPLRHVDAGVLNIAWYEEGPATGPVVMLLHGFPYDIHSYVDVAPQLAAQGCRVIVPYLRGYGPTRFRDPATPRSGEQAAIGADLMALMDALGVFVVWLICHGAVGAWFTGATGQDKLAAAVLLGIFSWRLYVLLFRIVLQPDMPNARLCDVRGPDARTLYIRVSLVMLLIILGRILGQVLVAIHTPPLAMTAYHIIVLLIYLSTFIWLVVRSGDGARRRVRLAIVSYAKSW